MLIKTIINLLTFYQKVFKGNHYSCRKISQAYFICDQRYDRVIRDYYEYVESLIAKDLVEIHTPCLVLLDCSGFSWLNTFLPIKKIAFQIEHTLVKPGARDCEGAIQGHVAMLGGSERYLVRLVNALQLEGANLVIEYSQINQLNIQKSPDLKAYTAKSFCISPALYPLLEYSLDSSSYRTLNTVTLFGNPEEPRRKKFLVTLATLGINSQNINQVFDGIEDLYRNTQILINIRQTDHHDTLEELRVLPALRCGVIVVSERAPLIERTRYSQYIIWGELDELPALVKEVQSNYDYWHKKIFDNSGFISRMNRISRRNQLVSLRAVKYLGDL
ncbi:hypothetical protein [Polynucleobacter sp. JS-JIR-II-b4]|uniref:hypothetical protein n=1 Tax=Polynucleobacter sp. JS-JIR-II-b4 TaxID=1758390 RepID=UPI001BFDE4BF|nr:hypothetical protein [Polynucleobacter sp. JS-JIR-II-b4]QWE02773.1 hypothetical protein ICV90_01395 [Polynucleobacter sp. JS-JIR-II-b4]